MGENDHELTDAERAFLVAKIKEKDSNLEKVAAESGASELALAKAVAGIPCQKGTIALARNYVAKCGG
jgi:lambda repressor-like predicted transcriptional regulator